MDIDLAFGVFSVSDGLFKPFSTGYAVGNISSTSFQFELHLVAMHVFIFLMRALSYRFCSLSVPAYWLMPLLHDSGNLCYTNEDKIWRHESARR